METMDDIRKSYQFSGEDEKNLPRLAGILIPLSDELARDFYEYLMADPRTASYFPNSNAVKRRHETTREWLRLILTGPYDRRLLIRLARIGEVHVKIGLAGHHVNAAMNFIRSYCVRHVIAAVPERTMQEDLLETLNKVLDISLDVMTGSYREAELKKVFLSYRVESALIQWSERFVQGLNLVLTIGLVIMAVGLASLFASDVFYAFTGDLERGVIKALGSLLILWMLIELLHTEVKHLRGGKFRVVVFVELALAAFIRKIFVASFDKQDPVTFGLLLGALLILGLVFFLVGRTEGRA
ncbi:MAG: protoglobin domain-containing protein [Thermodesulfobacteriota bacterium]